MGEWTAETAEWYAERYGEHATNRLGIDAIELEADAVVVDVGCGTGAALRHAAKRVTAGRWIGIDPVPRMVEIARERLDGHPAASRVELREGGAEALPLEDGSADVVLAFDSFDHWMDRVAGLSEVRRVLRPHGRFVVVKDGGVPGASKAARKFVETVTAAGFEVVEERTVEADAVAFALWVCRSEET